MMKSKGFSHLKVLQIQRVCCISRSHRKKPKSHDINGPAGARALKGLGSYHPEFQLLKAPRKHRASKRIRYRSYLCSDYQRIKIIHCLPARGRHFPLWDLPCLFSYRVSPPPPPLWVMIPGFALPRNK